MKRYFLFDLDGTVTDTGDGIMKSAQYALDAFGFPGQSEKALRRFVGPPLHLSFQRFYGLTEEQSLAAVEKYRERYREKGVFESPLYPGIDRLLSRLSRQVESVGGKICLATSKPILFARQILDLRDVAKYFPIAVGANMDGTMTDKAQVIAQVLRQLGDPPKEEVVMIGDRENDVLGAKKNGLETVGAGYGYAVPGELEAAGAEFIVPTVEALEKLLLSMTGGANK